MNRKLLMSCLSFVWTLLTCSLSQAQGPLDPTLDMNTCMPVQTNEYAAKVGDTLNTQIKAKNVTGNITWALDSASGACTTTTVGAACFNGKVMVTIPAPGDPSSTFIKIAGGPLLASDVSNTQGQLGVLAADTNNTRTCGPVPYALRITADGGGWGDPHLTTVDGINYDFQGAGEYTALRTKDFEVQTRSTPVPTATVPVSNDYTGISSCVSIYSAVALRIGTHRVSYQPNKGFRADPTGMQLRVNGEATTIPREGIDLYSPGTAEGGKLTGRHYEGHIANAPTGGGAIEITNTLGTNVVVGPTPWPAQQTWFLTINVYGTDATLGTMGKVLDGWLPALPDGSSVGQKPEALHERYESLNKKFGDAWRVTDTSSLFDYDPGTTTANFTVSDWPREGVKSCGIEGQVSVTPATVAVAEQACSVVNDKIRHGNCVFDVTVTGNTDFGKSYAVMQQLAPGGTTPATPATPTTHGIPWWLIALILLLIIVILWFARSKK